ncbi:MAG: sigma-54-dependent Fis family transcriptional regulator [Gammaproteobacteria bacterium]|nr:sigma-54-dependent Fis family transcriptional regulator [Gammaproteobacteria bacterium]
MTAPDVYFIDDELDLRLANEQTLELAGFTVALFEKAEDVLPRLSDQVSGVVVSDIRLPGMNGLDLLQQLQQVDAELPVILITGHGDISMAVGAMQKGAYDFIEKPFSSERLVDTVKRGLDTRRLTLENRDLKIELNEQDTLGPRLIGKTAVMKSLRRSINQLADTSADILLMGETGTGKELVARSLHEKSSRRERNFVAINCGAIPENLIESELFGHERGAFTGAETQRIGKFEYADHGTVFLDEIESMPMPTQVRLLRVLQERSLERLGSNEGIDLDIRIISASKLDLKKAVERAEFREDLFYRLNVVTLELPPLRERREDIPLLFQHFLLYAAARYGKEAPATPPGLSQNMMSFNWPGNVRELHNAAERFVLLGDEGGLRLDDQGSGSPGAPMSLPQHVEIFERALIEQALSESGGVIKRTMELLGLPRKTLYDKMQKYGLDKRGFK